MEKSIIFLVSSSPFATLNNYEALRTAMSLFDHKVSIIWESDGVFYPLNGSDKAKTQPFLRLMKDLNVSLVVDLDDLKKRGVALDEVIEGVESFEHDRILDMLAMANVVISF
ncbi:MAG: DsrE family protein [Candidatus Bathyarchaeia archaeon]|jgi:sulfur relay (sulfurtransferase) DsrF/TusC family protein